MIASHLMCVIKQLFMIKISCMWERKTILVKKPWQNMTNFRITKRFKKNNKILELPPFGKFVTEVLIFRSSRSQMFFKIDVLKNSVIFTGKHLHWPLQAFFYKTPTDSASGFLRQQILSFSWIWYLSQIVAPASSPISFENTS